MKNREIFSLARIITALISCIVLHVRGLAVEPADTVKELAELNVVALKQSEQLRDDALSGSVLGRLQLEEMNATAIKNISDAVPNLYIPEYGSRVTSTIYVRGIGARIDQPAIGLVVDNVPLLNKNDYDFDLADIASVEMLRGPQSTLYGRNTIGGLINITTLSPMRVQGVRLSLSGANGNDWKASAGWYGKHNSRFANALIVSFSYLGGFHRNLYNGKLADKEMSGALRWKSDARLSDRVMLRNAASFSLLRQGGYPYQSIDSGEISYNDTCFYRRNLFTDGLILNWRQGKFDFSSITSIQYLDDNMTLDQDFLPLPYFTLEQKQRELGFTEDVVFRGRELDDKYEWKAGIFAFGKRIHMNAPVNFGDTGISELIENHRNEANPDYPISWQERSFRLGSEFTIPTWGVALYHESTFHVGRWKLTAGLRLDREHSALKYLSRCNTGYEVSKRLPEGDLEPYRHVAINIEDSGKMERSYFNWLPKISVLYNLPLEGENNVYASVAKGYKAGGYNTQMFSEVLQQRLMESMGIGQQHDVDEIVGYRPEYSWNYEVGSHLSFSQAGLILDFSLFYIDCRDQQLTMFPPGTTTGRMMTNAGRTRSCGAEISADWHPLKQLVLRASYGYTNAKFLDFFNGLENFKGKYVPYAPQNTIYGQVDYSIPTGSGFIRSVDIEANVRANGRVYWNESNTLWQEIYALPGASVTLNGKDWSLQIWGRNLSNTDYDTFYFLSMGNRFLQKGRPLQIGATMRCNIPVR